MTEVMSYSELGGVRYSELVRELRRQALAGVRWEGLLELVQTCAADWGCLRKIMVFRDAFDGTLRTRDTPF